MTIIFQLTQEKVGTFYLGFDVSRHDPVRVETHEVEYLRQEAGFHLHVELDMRVTLEEWNVRSEAGQLLYRRVEEPSTPELSNCQYLITHK